MKWKKMNPDTWYWVLMLKSVFQLPLCDIYSHSYSTRTNHLSCFSWGFKQVPHELSSPRESYFCGKGLLASGDEKTNKCCWVLCKSLRAAQLTHIHPKLLQKLHLRTWHWVWDEFLKVNSLSFTGITLLLVKFVYHMTPNVGMSKKLRKHILLMFENMWGSKGDLQKIYLGKTSKWSHLPDFHEVKRTSF